MTYSDRSGVPLPPLYQSGGVGRPGGWLGGAPPAGERGRGLRTLCSLRVQRAHGVCLHVEGVEHLGVGVVIGEDDGVGGAGVAAQQDPGPGGDVPHVHVLHGLQTPHLGGDEAAELLRVPEVVTHQHPAALQ